MKIVDAIKDALQRRDAAKAGRLCNKLRFNLGLKYADIIKFVEKAGYTRHDWEELMYEADRMGI
jgi:hypothetical protein